MAKSTCANPTCGLIFSSLSALLIAEAARLIIEQNM